jgi:hypothetical protein
MSLETDIDDLYKGPLGEFTAARNALAKTLSGDAAKRVKALAKPTLVPWTVNQLYWHGRQAYTRLMAAGESLRAAQIAALEGKAARLAKAADAHKTVLAAAVKEAVRIAGRDGSRPNADELSRTLEALSLSAERRSPPGRLTEAVAPAGFEALAGMSIAAPKAIHAASSETTAERRKKTNEDQEEKAAADARRRELERQIQSAERDLERAKSAEASARERLENAVAELRKVEDALAALRAQDPTP